MAHFFKKVGTQVGPHMHGPDLTYQRRNEKCQKPETNNATMDYQLDIPSPIF